MTAPLHVVLPCEDVVFAVSETVSNCVDHAYPGPPGPVAVTITAAPVDPVGAHRLTVVVADRGQWRQPPADPGRRGRGLAMTRSVVDRVDVVPRVGGTTVTMQHTLSCPAARSRA